MTTQQNNTFAPPEESTLSYKSMLFGKINELQKEVSAAPQDIEFPRESVVGFLAAAAELVNCGSDPSSDPAEVRARGALSRALTPLGLYVAHRAYPVICDF